MTEPFVPKEEGFYWYSDQEGGGPYVVWVTPNPYGPDGELIGYYPGDDVRIDLKVMAREGAFHPGPIQPPEESNA